MASIGLLRCFRCPRLCSNAYNSSKFSVPNLIYTQKRAAHSHLSFQSSLGSGGISITINIQPMAAVPGKESNEESSAPHITAEPDKESNEEYPAPHMAAVPGKESNEEYPAPHVAAKPPKKSKKTKEISPKRLRKLEALQRKAQQKIELRQRRVERRRRREERVQPSDEEFINQICDTEEADQSHMEDFNQESSAFSPLAELEVNETQTRELEPATQTKEAKKTKPTNLAAGTDITTGIEAVESEPAAQSEKTKPTEPATQSKKAKSTRLAISPDMAARIKAVESVTRYTFKDPALLIEALQGRIKKVTNIGDRVVIDGNKRLAMIGDSVLHLLLLEDWYHKPLERRKEASELLARISSNENLDEIGRALQFDKLIYMNNKFKGIIPRDIMTATVEAIIGAIYTCGDLVEARKAIYNMGLFGSFAAERSSADASNLESPKLGSDIPLVMESLLNKALQISNDEIAVSIQVNEKKEAAKTERHSKVWNMNSNRKVKKGQESCSKGSFFSAKSPQLSLNTS